MLAVRASDRHEGASGTVVYTAPQDALLHLGYGDLALTESRIVHLATGAAAAITGLPEGTIHTVRAALPDRFLVVLTPEQSEAGGSAQELWQLDSSGAATMLGAFPPLPANATRIAPWSSQLDAHGALFQIGEGLAVFEDVIVRREIQGASAVVYDEATNPLVKIHISALVTGP